MRGGTNNGVISEDEGKGSMLIPFLFLVHRFGTKRNVRLSPIHTYGRDSVFGKYGSPGDFEVFGPKRSIREVCAYG